MSFTGCVSCEDTDVFVTQTTDAVPLWCALARVLSRQQPQGGVCAKAAAAGWLQAHRFVPQPTDALVWWTCVLSRQAQPVHQA